MTQVSALATGVAPFASHSLTCSPMSFASECSSPVLNTSLPWRSADLRSAVRKRLASPALLPALLPAPKPVRLLSARKSMQVSSSMKRSYSACGLGRQGSAQRLHNTQALEGRRTVV